MSESTGRWWLTPQLCHPGRHTDVKLPWAWGMFPVACYNAEQAGPCRTTCPCDEGQSPEQWPTERTRLGARVKLWTVAAALAQRAGVNNVTRLPCVSQPVAVSNQPFMLCRGIAVVVLLAILPRVLQPSGMLGALLLFCSGMTFGVLLLLCLGVRRSCCQSQLQLAA